VSNRLILISLALFGAFVALPPAHAAIGVPIPLDVDIVNPVVEGNTFSAKINAGIGIAAVNVELSIEFEQAVGLSAENLGLSVDLVSLTDLALLSRLPVSLNTSLVSGLPVLLRIQPPASGGLSFSGITTIELYTHNLQYTAGTPLRLFSASDGGTFRDITESMSSGSYRVRGSKGTFSDFLIVADLRPTATVINGKFGELSDLLYGYSSQIEGTTFAQLESQLTAAQSAWDGGDTTGAIAGIETFASTVENAASSDIPDVWRSTRDLDNVAGELRAKAGTLRFSLTLASNSL